DGIEFALAQNALVFGDWIGQHRFGVRRYLLGPREGGAAIIEVARGFGAGEVHSVRLEFHRRDKLLVGLLATGLELLFGPVLFAEFFRKVLRFNARGLRLRSDRPNKGRRLGML